MSACGNCGAAFEADESRCEICGAERRRDASVEFSLTSLQPEAEPPLPAAHDELRGGTPSTGIRAVAAPTRLEKHVPGSLAALAPLATPLPMTVPPPRNIDVDVGLDQPSWALPPTPVPAPATSDIPSLTGGGSWVRRSLLVVLLCLAAGAVVGWLLSQPEPTPDEIRARQR
jgi:hypothetical protein